MMPDWLKPVEAFLHREDRSSLCGRAATESEIAEAQSLLNVTFHDDYVIFIRAFGGAYAGLAVHAFANGDSIGNETVTALTLSYREQFADSPFRADLDSGYVISMDGSGNPILMTEDGQAVLLDHDTGEKVMLASSFAALIEENFYAW